MAYKPFLIANQRTGQELNLDPWLLPPDAYQVLTNFYLYEGRIQKRNGRTEFGQTVHHVTMESGSLAGGWFGGLGWFEEPWFEVGSEGTIKLSQYPVRAGTLSFYLDTGEGYQDNGDGTLTGNAGGSGTINYTTGEIVLSGSGSVFTTLEYDYYPGYPIMGLFNYDNLAGSQQLLAFDKRRMDYYHPTDQVFYDIGDTDVWTGGDANFFFLCNWQNVGYIINGVDQIQAYTGALTPFKVDFVGDGDNHLSGGIYLAQYKNRLVIFRPTEDGLNYNQRIRWCEVGAPGTWVSSGYLDADSPTWLIGGAWIQDLLIGFFERGVQGLVYLGDPRLPFYWQNIVSNEGCLATNGIVELDDEVGFLSITRIAATDGHQTYYLDERIPHLMLEMNQDAINCCYTAVDEAKQQVYLSYPSKAVEQFCDRIAVYNLDDASWAQFDMSSSCFGYYEESHDITWADLTTNWEDLQFKWNERSLRAGYPLVLCGDIDGKIYKLDDPLSSESISANALTGELNPFVKEGTQARLGWVDLLVDSNPSFTLQVDFYINGSSNPYQTFQVPLDDGLGNPKSWLRLPSGVVGRSHTFGFSHSGTGGGIVMHAVIPYFQPGGPLR